ncbi:MAG: hypothetical protein QM572_02090 [Nocardioides sp.]|uniref:hypothetical protein n=1 Tax=Nocardioides sp. TaxID=35761 RepID=UPI0039E41DA1
MTYTDTDVARLPLAEAKDELLAELLATPYDVRPRPATPLRRHRILRASLAGVAAAVVAAVGITVVVQRDGGDGLVGGYPAKLVSMAERMPRILLDADGWTIASVYGFGEAEGTLDFVDGDQDLEINWRAADSYDDYFHDRNDASDIGHEPTSLFGRAATLFTYGGHDHATMLGPDGRSFVELRGQGMSRKAYLALTARLREVSVQEFLAAMPASVVVPGTEGAAAQKVLADIPVPPGFRYHPVGGVDDAYQFGAKVTSQVFCSWVAVYRSGDATTRQQAVDALESSHDWKVLNDMNEEGDWPEVVWEMSDQIAAGDLQPQESYDQGLGCDDPTYQGR